MNGHSLGSDAKGRASLKGDLREFLGGEVPLHQPDDLTKVNPVNLETGMGLPPDCGSERIGVQQGSSAPFPQFRPRFETPAPACAAGSLGLHLGSPGQALL